MSQFRKQLKDTVEAKIDALYHLNPEDENYEHRLDALLDEKRYIFPGDPLKVCLCLLTVYMLTCFQVRADQGKAYDHPIFISVVRSFIFGSRLYLFQVHAPLFREEYGGRVYKIIPYPFVAFIATAVCFYHLFLLFSFTFPRFFPVFVTVQLLLSPSIFRPAAIRTHIASTSLPYSGWERRNPERSSSLPSSSTLKQGMLFGFMSYHF